MAETISILMSMVQNGFNRLLNFILFFYVRGSQIILRSVIGGWWCFVDVYIGLRIFNYAMVDIIRTYKFKIAVCQSFLEYDCFVLSICIMVHEFDFEVRFYLE